MHFSNGTTSWQACGCRGSEGVGLPLIEGLPSALFLSVHPAVGERDQDVELGVGIDKGANRADAGSSE
jgi:hypothetical protein